MIFDTSGRCPAAITIFYTCSPGFSTAQGFAPERRRGYAILFGRMITVAPSDRFPYRLIAAATDGSPNSLDAVRHAAGLAALMGARLAVVYVVDAYLSFRMGVHRDMAVETLRPMVHAPWRRPRRSPGRKGLKTPRRR